MEIELSGPPGPCCQNQVFMLVTSHLRTFVTHYCFSVIPSSDLGFNMNFKLTDVDHENKTVEKQVLQRHSNS